MFGHSDDPAAVALYVAHYNLCRAHEALRMTQAMALGIVDRAGTIGDRIDAALGMQPITPVNTAPERRKRFKVIDGGREYPTSAPPGRAGRRLSDAVESLNLGLNWWSWPESETAPVKALERARRRG
jgi:hypothetical protein